MNKISLDIIDPEFSMIDSFTGVYVYVHMCGFIHVCLFWPYLPMENLSWVGIFPVEYDTEKGVQLLRIIAKS